MEEAGNLRTLLCILDATIWLENPRNDVLSFSALSVLSSKCLRYLYLVCEGLTNLVIQFGA